VSLNAQMNQYALSTDLEKRLVPQLIQLVLSRLMVTVYVWATGTPPN